MMRLFRSRGLRAGAISVAAALVALLLISDTAREVVGSPVQLIGHFHLFVALTALISGLIVCLLPKGTWWHRRVGWVYVASLVSVNATALLIYNLFGRFGPFHWAALASLGTVAAGLVPALRRRSRRLWLEQHAQWMSWSFVGLLAAAVSEVSTRYLNTPFGATVIAATASVLLIGGILIERLLTRALRPWHAVSVQQFSRPPERREDRCSTAATVASKVRA